MKHEKTELLRSVWSHRSAEDVVTLKPACPSLPVITREKLVNKDASCCSSPIKEFDSFSNKTPKMRLKATKTPPPRSWREIAAHEVAAVCKQVLLLCDGSVFSALNGCIHQLVKSQSLAFHACWRYCAYMQVPRSSHEQRWRSWLWTSTVLGLFLW